MANISKPWSGNVHVDYKNNTVDIVNHDGSAEGLKLGGTLVTSTAAELNLVNNAVADVSIAYAASLTTDGLEATITVEDAAGVAIAAIHNLQVYISDDTNGSGLTATAASGTLTATTGTILTAYTAKKHVSVNTDANGIAVLLLVDSANTVGERFVVVNPVNGKLVVGAASAATDYEGGV